MPCLTGEDGYNCSFKFLFSTLDLCDHVFKICFQVQLFLIHLHRVHYPYLHVAFITV
jgi:hypothetical protein